MKQINKVLFSALLCLTMGLTSCGESEPQAPAEPTEAEKWEAAPRLDSLDDTFTFRKTDFDKDGKIRLKIGGFEDFHYYGVITDYLIDGQTSWYHIMNSMFNRLPMAAYEEDNVTRAQIWSPANFKNNLIYKDDNAKLDYMFDDNSEYETLTTQLYGIDDFIFRGSNKDIHILIGDSEDVSSNRVYRVHFYNKFPVAHEIGEDGFCPSYHTDHFDGFFNYNYDRCKNYGGNNSSELIQSGDLDGSWSNVKVYISENLDSYTRSGDSPFDGDTFIYNASLVDLNGNTFTTAEPVYVPDMYADLNYGSSPTIKAIKFVFPKTEAPKVTCKPSNAEYYFFKVVLTPKAGYDLTNVVGSVTTWHAYSA